MAACSSTPTQTEPAPVAAPAAPTPARPAPPSTASTAPVPVQTASLAAHLDPSSAVSRNRSVYFEFDDATLQTKYRSVIEVQGDYLSRNPNLHVRVEGNTDERGSSEYNLALGQRRAEAVTGALKLYGVKDSQVEAVSFGREKPKAAGHDEAAWAENRRADVVYPGAK